MDINRIIGRSGDLFQADMADQKAIFSDAIEGARILVFGGAGSIGKEVVAQIFQRGPAALHVIDINENNLVELVRNLRSSLGYTGGDTSFLPLDMGSVETKAFLAAQKPYDYILNIAAMKHVRSEKDAYSLMRMIKVNVLDTFASLTYAETSKTRKYFAVSTDKAQKPANLMGATKRIMEKVLFNAAGDKTAVSTARFANVAFSDGSLLYGFHQRMLQRQPISAPRDVKRYFITGKEAGYLCLASLVLGHHREVFFPKTGDSLQLEAFPDIAARFLAAHGYEVVEAESEDWARREAEFLIAQGKWPCYFFDSDTSGEKPAEEFYAEDDDVDWDRFKSVAVIRARGLDAEERQRVDAFLEEIRNLRTIGTWNRAGLIAVIQSACPDLDHVDTGRFLDSKM